MVVADFGCGSGHYTLACAKVVTKTGTVYALDIQQDLLKSVKSSADLNNFRNVEIIWADLEAPEGSHLVKDSVDVVIVSNLLFQAENRGQIAKEAFRVLKNGGRAGVIEWDVSEKGKFGPALSQRISKEKSQALFLQEGFRLEKEFQPGDNHYGLIFIKP